MQPGVDGLTLTAMSQVLGLITQDAALVRCELDRVRAAFVPAPGAVTGVGGWQEGQVILHRHRPGEPNHEVFDAPESQVVILGERALGPNQSVEDSTPPFRFRQWLFAAVGQLDRAAQVRERVWEELPEFLQTMVRGPSWEEAVFARFLTELRELGRIEDPSLDHETAAGCLHRAAQALAQTSADVGITRKPGFLLVASNGRMLLGTRFGAQPAGYALLEGSPVCARHELTEASSDEEALVRDHRRRRSVVITSSRPEGWVELPENATLAVDRKLTTTVRAL